MAKVIENTKGFKVVELSLTELNQIGGYGICDWCNSSSFTGYYIAVLNHWYCPKCYEEWLKRATYYAEDAMIEERNFASIKAIFNL